MNDTRASVRRSQVSPRTKIRGSAEGFAAVCYDESDACVCPSCQTVMTWSSGQKKFCPACGFVDACCN